MKPKFAIIRFPGTNRQREALRTANAAGFDAFYFRWNDDFEILREASAYLLPGGFSYEDRSRSGIMCALDPVMEVVREEAGKGKPVLGICNGAQMLIESGMVPGGVKNKKPLMCLARNVRKDEEKLLGTGFLNTWISMKSDLNPKRSAFSLKFTKDEIVTCPIAHGEGRYTTLNEDLIKTLEANQQILFKYCDEKGEIIEKYPVNPNGACDNIAAIINPVGNIMAAMPHFEHFYQIGKPIFDSMFEYVIKGNSIKNLEIPNLKTLPEYKVPKLAKYKSGKRSFEMFVRLIITDNEADSVNSVLENIGFQKTNLERFIHFEIEHDYTNEELLEKLPAVIRTGELLNTNKEVCEVKIANKTYKYFNDKGLIEEKNRKFDNAFLVRETDDYIGMGKCQNLKNKLSFMMINVIKRGVLWDFRALKKEKVEEILNTRILHNPHAQLILEY